MNHGQVPWPIAAGAVNLLCAYLIVRARHWKVLTNVRGWLLGAPIVCVSWLSIMGDRAFSYYWAPTGNGLVINAAAAVLANRLRRI